MIIMASLPGNIFLHFLDIFLDLQVPHPLLFLTPNVHAVDHPKDYPTNQHIHVPRQCFLVEVYAIHLCLPHSLHLHRHQVLNPIHSSLLHMQTAFVELLHFHLYSKGVKLHCIHHINWNGYFKGRQKLNLGQLIALIPYSIQLIDEIPESTRVVQQVIQGYIIR